MTRDDGNANQDDEDGASDEPALLQKAKKEALLSAKAGDSGEEEEDEGGDTDVLKDRSSGIFAASSVATAEDDEPYVNQGFLKWQTGRNEWLASCVRGGPGDDAAKLAIPLDVDEIIDLIFSHRWRDATVEDQSNFPQAVPLPQMVDILVDLWEAEGLDI